MNEKHSANVSIKINAPVSKVWKALTTPEIVKQWMFGTTVTTDWKKGSSINYTGEWEGKKYEDKGEILEIEENKIIKTTYWSGMSGTEDIPENYQIVTYILEEQNSKTKLTITQENCKTEEQKTHSEENWKMVLGKIKEILE